MTDRSSELTELIRRLGELTREATRLAEGNPAATRNLYMIGEHIKMLEIEVCEPLEVLREGATDDDG